MRDQRWWTWHVGAGLVLLVFLGLHMAIMHVDTILGLFNRPGTEAIDWNNVAARARSASRMRARFRSIRTNTGTQAS